MLKKFALFFGIVAILYPKRESAPVGGLAIESARFYQAVAKKATELLEDPIASDAEWEELLPVCRYADEFFIDNNPGVEPPPSLGDLAERALEGGTLILR